jgi:hypothetical protein
LMYPTFERKCKAAQRAVVKYVCNRDTQITGHKVKSELKRMALDGILVQSMDSHGKIVYTRRICETGEPRTSLNLRAK